MIRNRVLSVVSNDCAQSKQLIERFTTELTKLPSGTLFTRTTGGKKRFYCYKAADNDTKLATETYLNKTQEDLIALLARRKFVEMSVDTLESNIEILEPALSGYVVYDPVEVIHRMPKAYAGIECSNPSDMMEQNNPSTWANEAYEKSAFRSDALNHKSQNGVFVRSKSETIIASQLEYNNIPYRYEQRLDMPDQFFYPDFTILNPEDNQIIYWEHFGLMDDEDYGKSAASKLDAYQSAGIVQWNNLITTYETSRIPLDAHKVQRIIKAFLLPETP